MWKARLKSWLVKAGELVLVLALVLVFFAMMLRFMDSLFPSGIGLNTLVKRGGLFSRDHDSAPAPGRDIGMSGVSENRGPAQPLVAKLSSLHHQVKSKRAQDISWNAASAGMALYDRDAVQTLAKSGARIEFDSRSYLTLGENALVIIKRFEQDAGAGKKRSVVVMMQGALQGRIATVPGESQLAVEVALPNAVARVTPPVDGGSAQFRIEVKPDQSSTVVVMQGSAEVEAQGRTVQVKADQVTSIMPDRAPTASARLPKPVTVQRPASDSVYYYRDLPPRIEFGWKALPGADGYHFVLARDAAFSDVVGDERLSASQFTHGNLKAGDYYWRVAPVDNGGDGPMSEARRIRLVQDRQPPVLEVDFPADAVTVQQLTLQGRTEPGAQLSVGGHDIKPDEQGQFSWQLTLQPGLNVVVVEAEDAAGNVAYSSRVVNAKVKSP